VRELENVLYRAAAASDEPEIGPEHVVLRTAFDKPAVRALRAEDVLSLLEEHGGNVAAAARAARVPRSTFRARLKRLR
jgi:transcriptional regulator of acetoin/glycerol metabolism